MKWYIPTQNSTSHWLEEFIPKEKHSFHAINAHYDHDRSRNVTNKKQWVDYFNHGLDTYNAARRDKEKSGVITFFPQLPAVIGLRKKISTADLPVLAWGFNIGNLQYGLKGQIAKFALREISKFFVWSRDEINQYSQWLNIAPERFEFMPYHRHMVEQTIHENVESPYIISLGTAGRDYKLYLEVLESLKIPAVIITGAHAVNGLKIPSNVKIMNGLSATQCHELLQGARFAVAPLASRVTAAGQVSIIDAMMFGKAQVVTKTPSTQDYLSHNSEALFVGVGDYDGLREGVEKLWLDDTLRKNLGEAAKTRMRNEFSDQAIIPHLIKVLDAYE